MPVVKVDLEPLAFVFKDNGSSRTTGCRSWSIRPLSMSTPIIPRKPSRGYLAPMAGATMWRNGVYDYLHYHATVHEALGVARGRALVRFGGDAGEELDIGAGDVAILPAGTGHQCISPSADFCVIGAYPPGPKMQITRPTPANHALALKTIPQVKVPTSDPVMGKDGPLTRLWRS